jgi:uncharacterized protein (TIGR02588 family)
MAPRKAKPARKSLVERTPIAEWTAAAVGLLLTLAAVGYSVWEAVTGHPGPPALQVEAEPPEAVAGGHVVPLRVRNGSHATAAGVEVRGVLEQAGRVVEERRAHFAYVPGKGEAKGGLVFERDPKAFTLRVAAEGYAEP